MINAEQRLLGQNQQARQPQHPGIHISVVIKVTTLVFVALFIVTGALVIISRTPDAHFNPFAAYAGVLPGQPWENAEAYGFECNYGTGTQWLECFLQPPSGDFSRVWLSIDNGIIASVLFTPRKGTLSLGDVALLLGVPQRWGAVHFNWSEDRILAYVPTNAGRFNYYVPILNISLQ